MVGAPRELATVWLVLADVEPRTGCMSAPRALAAQRVRSNDALILSRAELETAAQPPYPTTPVALIVTFTAQDLAATHLALGWPMPERLIDLAIEFRKASNGRQPQCGFGLAGALVSHGLPASLALGRAETPTGLLRRLEAVNQLYASMEYQLDWGRALLRGRYMVAVTRIEAIGVPLDLGAIACLSTDWHRVRRVVARQIDQNYGFYDGLIFKTYAFKNWLEHQGINWPQLIDGRLDLRDDAFRDMARADARLQPVKELRAFLAGPDPRALSIGCDGRNRTPLRPFASRTGRNQPSTKASILGGPAWTRFLVRPDPGKGLALIDWCQQEFGIAAALSGDTAMQAAYQAGDPYIAFAVASGAAPEGATAQTHPDVRVQFKACALGVQYGMGARTLARMLNTPVGDAERLLERHRRIFPSFWHWSDAIEAEGLLRGRLQSVFGWQVNVGADANPRFLRNFPMQANGAEMLRLACCLTTEAGIRVCATLHDALLIEAGLEDLEKTIADTQQLMAEASAIVLDGFELRSEVRCVRYPERLGDERGRVIWSIIEKLKAEGRP